MSSVKLLSDLNELFLIRPVEKSAVVPATQTLEQSRDRFSSGVTDNIEVVQAQDALAIAKDAYIASLYSYNLAKISLARAVGAAESHFAEFVMGKYSEEQVGSHHDAYSQCAAMCLPQRRI